MAPDDAAAIAEYRSGAASLRARANRSMQAGDPVQAERDLREAVLLEGDAERLESGQTRSDNAQADGRLRHYGLI